MNDPTGGEREMKRIAVLSLLVVASILIAGCGGAPAPAEEAVSLTDLGGKTITVAVENAYPPFNYIDEASGKPAGWDYDAVTEICGRLNCKPDFKQAAWEGIFPAMAAGEFDFLADGVTRLYERELIVEFSIPYVTIGQVLLINAADEIADLDAFKADPATVVGTQIGTTNEIVAKRNFPVENVQSFEEFGGAVAALMAGDIDAVVIDNVSAIGFINANPGKLKVGPQLTSDEQLCFAFPPGSTLTLSVNSAIRGMQADGTLKALNDKWFNPK
jgi:polar amino acid transport system substrate-binding protein